MPIGDGGPSSALRAPRRPPPDRSAQPPARAVAITYMITSSRLLRRFVVMGDSRWALEAFVTPTSCFPVKPKLPFLSKASRPGLVCRVFRPTTDCARQDVALSLGNLPTSRWR